MNEIRRFMRYTLPGLVFNLQLLIALSVSNWEEVKKALELLNEKSAVGIVLGSFLATGALGYILAIIYFGLYWSCLCKYIAIDHAPALADFENKFVIVNIKEEVLPIVSLSKRDLWIVLTKYWYSRKKWSEEIEGIDDMINRMSDITHGLGTNVVGSSLSMITWIILHPLISSSSRNSLFISIGIVVSWLVFIIICFMTYRDSHKTYERLINSTIRDVIRKELKDPERNGEQIKISYLK